MLRISILDGRHMVQSRARRDGVVKFFQAGYAHLGGAYPVEIEISLKNQQDALQPGDYTVDITSFRVGKFRNLELNPFELRLQKLDKPAVKAT